MKQKYYKYVRVVNESRELRVSSYVITEKERRGGLEGFTCYKRLSYSTRRWTTAPRDSQGIFITTEKRVHFGNIACFDNNAYYGTVELWEVEVKDGERSDLNCYKSIRLKELICIIGS